MQLKATHIFSGLLSNPETFQLPKQLQLLAQRTLHNFQQGNHNTKKYTTDYEFSQFRNYTPGDDVRLVDWKVYGKTQKLYIKQSNALQQISVGLIPDLSASMLYEEAGISKLNYSKYIFACLANLAFQQGDRVHLFGQKPYDKLMNCLTSLSQLQADKFWKDYQPDYNKAIHSKTKNLLIYCSDFYEYDDEMMTWLASTVKKGHEVIAFHLTAKDEKQLNFSKNTLLVDLETNETQRLNKTIIQEAAQNFSMKQQALKNKLFNLNIRYVEMMINQPVKNALITYLKLRANYKW